MGNDSNEVRGFGGASTVRITPARGYGLVLVRAAAAGIAIDVALEPQAVAETIAHLADALAGLDSTGEAIDLAAEHLAGLERFTTADRAVESAFCEPCR